MQLRDHVVVLSQVEGYGRFGSLSRVQLERFFHWTRGPGGWSPKRRGDHPRLGFAPPPAPHPPTPSSCSPNSTPETPTE